MASQLTTTPVAASDLISFPKALPDCRMRRGIRFPQWWMLLVEILAIQSGQGSPDRWEWSFAKRHRQTLNELLGTDFGKSESDSRFRLLLAGTAERAGLLEPAAWLDDGPAGRR